MNILKEKISERVHDKLVEADINSLGAILTKSKLELRQLTKLTRSEIKHLVQEAADVLLRNKFKPAFEVPEWLRLTTGCEPIDSITRKGIPVNGLTEIVGRSGVGKTQLCLQLALTVQFPVHLGGLNKGAVYICTEDVFPSKRLHQLAEMSTLRLRFEDNIFVEHIFDYEQLRRCLCIRLPRLLTQCSIGLIVIDSIAGVFRSETMGVNYVHRSQELLVIASQLNKLGSEHGVAIVIVNQVTDNMHSGKAEPCLGLAWSNLVTCRFEIARYLGNVRLFAVMFSPDLPCANCKFVITECGLTGVK